MASDRVAVATEMSVGAKIGGAAAVVALVSLAHAMSHAYGALLPLVIKVWRTELGLTYTQVGLMVSLSSVVWGPLQLGFGVLSRYAPQKLILGLGHVCQGLAVIGSGMGQGFGDLLAWRIAARVADAPQHPIGNALISQSFPPERRGTALAVNAAGSNLGTVAVPLLGGLLIAHLGWRVTLMAFGLFGAIVGLLLIGLLQEKDRQRPTGPRTTPLGRELWTFLRHRDARLLMGSNILGAGGRGLSVATIYVPLYLAQKLQIDEVRLGVLLTVMMVGSVIGPLIAGTLSDKVGRKPVLLVDYAMSCVCFGGLLTLQMGSWSLPAWLLLTGIIVYSEGAVMQTALTDIADRVSMDISMLFGLYFTVGAIMSAPWGWVLGMVVDHYGFPAAFMVMAGSQVLAALCVLPVRLRRSWEVAH